MLQLWGERAFCGSASPGFRCWTWSLDNSGPLREHYDPEKESEGWKKKRKVLSHWLTMVPRPLHLTHPFYDNWYKQFFRENWWKQLCGRFYLHDDDILFLFLVEITASFAPRETEGTQEQESPPSADGTQQL